MTRYVAFLRGVSPMNAKMADLRLCVEKLGFKDVKTVLSSGNVVFTSPERSEITLASQLEASIADCLPRGFPVLVRRADHLLALLEADPYAGFIVPPQAKRVVTFLNAPYTGPVDLPLETDGVQILCTKGNEVFTAYVPSDQGPLFMTLIEKTFGKNVTTRTWDTVRKCATA